MHTDFLFFASSRISYSRWGTGSKLILCFHGYGESAASFAFLEGPLGREFTILAIDLPFHGQTDWREGLFFDPRDLLTLIGKIIAGIPGIGYRWWLLGYSMGGRVALYVLQSCPEKIEKLILVAPDGLSVNGWYWLSTQTRGGNWLFRQTMHRPGWFFLILRLGNKLKLVNQSIYKFTLNYIGDRQAREILYKRWTTLRGFRPGIGAIKAAIREKNIPVRLLYGQYDRIIRWERAEKFKAGIEPWCKLVILPSGHKLLQLKNLDVLLALLKE
jgi:pimeloyl-ACP methyl ester carboxylesterase